MKDKSKKLLVINTNKKPSSTQSSGGTPSGGGFGGVAIGMSDYLLKAVWDRVFELKTDKSGAEYLFSKLPLATQYGITMYADGGDLDLPSIYAGLPIDGTTIYWDGEVLKAQGGGSGGGITDITSSMVVSALGYTPAKASDLTTLQSTVNDFLSGSDTDTIINKWKELEVFLSGLSESDNLATILGTKADEATTIAGYGITDAYTKSDVNTLLGDYVTLTTAQTITGEKNFTGGLKVNGSTIVYDATNKYWKLEGDLLVTGGITMFANEGTYTPSTIMDALKLDDTTLGINDEGQLYVKSGTGGVADSVRWENVIGRPTLLSSFTDDVVKGKYLPLSGGTINSTEALPITISNNINDGQFQVGISLLNPNKTNTNGNTYGTAQFGYTKSDGVYMFNYDNYNYYNCAIGITDDGIAYVGKGGSLDTKYKIWHEGNDGIGSGLDADLLDGLDSGAFFQSKGRFGSTYINSVLGNGVLWTEEYTPVTGAYNYGTVLNFRGDGRQTQFYITDGQQKVGIGGRIFFRDSWNAQETMSARWLEIITNENIGSQTVSKANQLTTARTIWGQSFDGTGNIDGDLKFGGNYCIKNPLGAGVFHPYNNYTIVGYDNCPNEKDTYIDGYKVHFRTHKSWEERLLIDETGNVGISVPITPLREFTLSTLRSKSHFRLHHNNIFGVYMMVDYNSGAFAIQSGYQNQAKALDIILQPRGGKIGIGTLAPSCSLHVVGDILSTGGITMYSDIRKKTKLQDVELTLQQIANAPLIEHYYNSDEKRTTHVGSIAQYWVSMNDWFCKLDGEGYYTMEVQNAALASAISIARELQRYESKTDKKIRLLKKRIGELEDEIEKLKTA